MVELRDLVRRGPWEWEIPTTVRGDMRVPVRVYASRELLEAIKGDTSLEQAVNATTLPGVVGEVVVMPDVHQGYGFPIGGVAATEYPGGVISPGAIGYDINCGVRLLGSRVQLDRAEGAMGELASALDAACPSGVGKGGRLALDDRELERACREGGEWARAKGWGTASDTARTEEGGFLEGAEFSAVSRRARDRGHPQMGTLGAGNHFIEVEVVDEIFDHDAAQGHGARRGLSDGDDPLRFARLRPPDLHRLRQDFSSGGEEIRHPIARSRAGVRPPRFARGPGLRSRHEMRRQLRLCQPPGPRPLRPRGLCRSPCAGGLRTPTSTRSTTSPTTWARPRST